MHWEQPTQYASISDIGFRRRNNQDSCVIQVCSDRETWADRGHLFMVADGMGGHAVGELASKIAVDTVPHAFFKIKNLETAESLKTAIETANSVIHERGIQNREFLRMGTTCSSLVLSPHGAIIGHVGDSRVYRIRNEKIDQLTFDHSLQWELLKQGKLSPDEIFRNHPRNIITRSLGPEETVQVDIEGPYAILPGDTYLICSDGLVGHLKDSEIGMIARELPVSEACRLLVNLANLRGGSDNITVVIAHVGDIPQQEPQSQPNDDAEKEDPAAWWRLGAGWGMAAMIFAGILLGLSGHWIAETIFLAVPLIITFFICSRYLAKKSLHRGVIDEDETIYWKTYRSASAKLSPKFVTHLAALEANLQRSALDEGWTINWSQHEAVYNKAKTALANKRYSVALREYAKTIEALMVGLHSQRKQIDLETRWGKTSSDSET